MGRSRTVTVDSGDRVEVIRRFGGSIPTDYTITVATGDGGPVRGTLEVRGSNWIWWKPVEVRPLVAEQVVTKGFWDTRFSVAVTPVAAVEVTVRTSAR